MLKIFNSITKKKEIFIFPKNKNIKIYICGITPYDNSHIGHARTFLIFDIIIRYFIYLGFKITYVRNITDIDDKIIKKSNNNNIHFSKLTEYFISEYRESFNKLNIISPNYEPKVTNHINDIINTIKILIKKNNAYKNNNGDILFNINSYKKYGELSNRNKDSNIKYKINNSDFVLWKNIIYKKNEPLWKSPWGFGRPGWHIECSTISNIFLNGEIDIHGGGIDLLFPHHENEYAQSICAYKNFNIKRWIHVGSVNFLSKKMSKSLNNNISLKEIFKFFNPEIVRFFLTNKHYRKPLNYDINQLKKNSISINKLYKTLLFFNINIKNKHKVINTEFTKEFINAMNDDFNTPKMYSILFKINKEIKKINSFKCPISLNLANEMKKLGSIIGILQQDPINFIKKKFNLINKKLSLIKIKYLIEKRNIERKNKNWKIADNIRNFLLKNNIILEDNYNKTTWKYIK